MTRQPLDGRWHLRVAATVVGVVIGLCALAAALSVLTPGY